MIYKITPKRDWQDIAYIFRLDKSSFDILVSQAPARNKIKAFKTIGKDSLEYFKSLDTIKETEEIEVAEIPKNILNKMIVRIFTTGIKRI